LRERGWLVPAYSMPPNREDLVIQRILIRHGFTREMAEELLRELERTIEHLQNPLDRPPRFDAASASHNHSGR
jgi:glutamate decarboxylase